MSLSPETQARVDHFRGVEEVYKPNSLVQRRIGSRSLNMIVAPAVTGKTLVMQQIAEMDSRFGRSRTLSTREPRPDDEPGIYRLLEHNDENMEHLLDMILSGKLVQYKIHPTENTFYGSEVQDHPHEHNMLATLSGGINQLQQVGFKETSVIGLVSPPQEWTHRFNARYPGRHPQYLKRAEEAKLSYTDLSIRNDVVWLVNNDGRIHETAKKVIRAIQHDPVDEKDEALEYVQRILKLTGTAIDRARSEKYE